MLFKFKFEAILILTKVISFLFILVPSIKCYNNHQYNQNHHNQTLYQLKQYKTGLGRSLVAEQTSTLAPLIPDFEEPIGNHTVAMGRDARLACKIHNLGNYRTAWLRVEDKGILTIHNNIITRNYRFGLIHDDEDGGRNFILTIKNVQPSDRGGYMCQINSVPMKSAVGYLDVLTPPAFDEPNTSEPNGLVTVTEGSNATLSCQASGHPNPLISWRREDGQPILPEGTYKAEGSTLTLGLVHRFQAGAYLCIASNGVQPAASRRQKLDVQFSPVIRIQQTELSGQLNQPQVSLVCLVELNPSGSYHWVKLRQSRTQTSLEQDDLSLIEHDELINSDKFEIVIKETGPERIEMILTIRNLDRQDFAYYKCIARNSLGIQSSSIKLYESSGGSSSSLGSQEEQQNDQAGSPRGVASRQGGGRAQTRSSWIQRPSGSSRQANGAQEQASSKAATSTGDGSVVLLLFVSFHLLLISCSSLLRQVNR